MTKLMISSGQDGKGAKDEPPAAKGTRATRKLETRRRIRDAAFDLFAHRGYDATTTKEIADAAGVATGTVFVHARDKADLLMLVMLDRLSAVVDACFTSLPRAGDLLDNLMHVFAGLFEMYGEYPQLSAAFVKAFPGSDGPNGQALNALTFAFLRRLASLVRDAQARGEVAAEVEPLLAAQNLFALYFFALLNWLTGLASLESSLDPLLKNALVLQIRGLQARPQQ